MPKTKGSGNKKDIKKSLLDSSSSSDSESEGTSSLIKQNESSKKKANKKGMVENEGFTINKGYADRYNSWRNLEEMQKLKDRLNVKNINDLNEDGSESESSSEEEEEWTPNQEKAFFKTLACLKKKDPKIYSDQFGFFKDVQNDEDGKESAPVEVKQKKGNKAFTVRDHERVMVLDKGGRYSDEDEESQGNAKSLTKSYNEELASIKTEFSTMARNIDSSDEEDDTLLGSKLLKKRVVKADEQEKDNEQYKLWLKGELDKVDKAKLTKDDEKELGSLRAYWTDDKLDDGEKFLRDYILNKKYIDPLKNDGKDYIPSYNEVVHDDDQLSDDEKFEAEREEFEHKYNFRFEEPDQEFIKRYPRTIQDSLRREDTKRKEQRQKTKERKEEVVSKKREEVQRLKAMKRNEIMDKIQKLHDISGNPGLEVTEMDIDGDFDPEEYDRRMNELFNDDYYQEAADGEKPEFPFDEAIDGDEENWDEWVPTGKNNLNTAEAESDDDEEENDDNGEDQEQEEPVPDQSSLRSRKKQATQNELIEASTGRRGRRKRSAFLDALEREKPKFNPKVHKSFEEYFEEYYKLDFEDVVGDLKCRFKYHSTTPNDFGLSTDEILKADDKELNQWASLKKTFQYRGTNEEAYEVQAYKKKSERQDLKKRILMSVYQPSPENENAQEENESEGGARTKSKKKRKNKAREGIVHAETTIDSDNRLLLGTTETSSALDHQSSSDKAEKLSKKNKRKNSSSNSNNNEESSSNPETISAPLAKPGGLSKRQRKNLKRKALAVESEGTKSSSNASHVLPPAGTEKGHSKKSKNKNKGVKRKAQHGNSAEEMPVDEDRLRAYGLNPTKFKKRMKYGSSMTK